MLRYITKDDYFPWVDRFKAVRGNYNSASENNLKDVQDHYIISKLSEEKGLKVLEIGGADCRVLRGFASQHECWNAEKFTGLGIGPKKEISNRGVRNVHVHLGDFSPELQDNSFDIVFSISVVEHVENPLLSNFFKDIARVLKPGGRTFHAIDVYLLDADKAQLPFSRYVEGRLQSYLTVPEMTDGSLEFIEQPIISKSPVFACSYATNSDREMMAWNRYAPQLKEVRSFTQSVSLMAEWRKTKTGAYAS